MINIIKNKTIFLFKEILSNSKDFPSQVSLLRRKEEFIKIIEEIEILIDKLIKEIENEK